MSDRAIETGGGGGGERWRGGREECGGGREEAREIADGEGEGCARERQTHFGTERESRSDTDTQMEEKQYTSR